MDISPAILIREVDSSERWDDVVNEAKALTWTYRCEIALIGVAGDKLLLLRGGADGISFEAADDAVWLTVDEQRLRVILLAWHTHPRPTGPSDHDRAFLRTLRQNSSLIYEMLQMATAPDSTRAIER